jgi:phytoene dehydrogenase-like protein
MGIGDEDSVLRIVPRILPMSKVLVVGAGVGRLLDIDWPIRPVEPAWKVHLPDRIMRWGDSSFWRAELERAFAGAHDLPAILRFNSALERMSDSVWDFASRRPAWPPTGPCSLVRTGLALRPRTLLALLHLFETMGQWVRRFGVTAPAFLTFLEAQLLISAQTTAGRASALFGAAAYDLPRKGVNHVEGGIGGIAAQLVGAIRRNGGQVLFHQEVIRLEARDGRIVAAHANKGLRVECDVCIANLTPWDMVRLLGDAAPPVLIHETQKRPDEWGAFTLYAGVEDDDAPMDHVQVISDYGRPLGETNSIFMSFSMLGDAQRAPAGHRALTISTHTRLADWWRLRDTPGARNAYQDRVAEYTEQMLANAEQAVPGLRRRIKLLLSGTPVTFRFYTRRHKGGVGGFPSTSIFAARGPWTGMRNAWLVGDSIFPGQSTAGVTIRALRVVDDITRACPGLMRTKLILQSSHWQR